MKTITITYTNGTTETIINVSKVWLENSTKRYVVHQIDSLEQEHHIFINRENVLVFDIMDPEGWKEKEYHPKKNNNRGGHKPYYTNDRDYDEE